MLYLVTLFNEPPPHPYHGPVVSYNTQYEFNTSAGGYIFFLNLAIISTRAYVDKYLVTSLALFFLSANFG